jgi:2'-5' RNA ligase
MRLFVAVDLSEDARAAIAAEQKRMAAARAGTKSSLKWVRPDQAHLTLVFLGNVDANRATSIVDAVGHDVDIAPFDIALGGVGVFPLRGAPRVLWIGIPDGAGALRHLQGELAARVSALGVAVEDRPFHPHLTLGRWRESRPSDRGWAVGAARSATIARVRVESATLYESKLSPSGPSYTALTRANLTPRTSPRT